MDGGDGVVLVNGGNPRHGSLALLVPPPYCLQPAIGFRLQPQPTGIARSLNLQLHHNYYNVIVIYSHVSCSCFLRYRITIPLTVLTVMSRQHDLVAMGDCQSKHRVSHHVMSVKSCAV